MSFNKMLYSAALPSWAISILKDLAKRELIEDILTRLSSIGVK
jgi:hypothetical protein